MRSWRRCISWPNQMMLDALEGPSEKFQERAQAIQAKLHAVLQDLAKPGTQTGRSRARRERSPSVEMVESDVKATGKTVAESRQTKRAREEKGAQKAAKRTLMPPKPDSSWCPPKSGNRPNRRRGPTATTTRSCARSRGTSRASAAIGPGTSRSVQPCTCASRPWSAARWQRQVASVRDLRPPPDGKDPGKGEHHHAQQPKGAGGPLLLRGRPRHVCA
jgi:hypothetical protein